MAKNWDKENMKVLGVNMKRDEAEAFQKLAKENDTTVGAMLRMHIQDTLKKQDNRAGRTERLVGVNHIVSYENTDKLKHEVSFYNPEHLNPDEFLNKILRDYFSFVESARRRSK